MKNFNDNTLTKIDHYLNNELKGDELKAFEAQMLQDAELTKEVQFQQQIVAGLREHAKLRERLKKIDQQTAKEQAVDPKIKQLKPRSSRTMLYVAAAAAVILCIFMFLEPLGESPSSAELYANNFEVYPIENTRSMAEDQEALLKKEAVEAYEKEEYERALEAFSHLKNNTPHQLYIGISLMQVEQYRNAVSRLDSLIALKTEERPLGLWYKALAQIKLEEKSAAKATLRQLLKETEGFKNLKLKAKKLKRKL